MGGDFSGASFGEGTAGVAGLGGEAGVLELSAGTSWNRAATSFGENWSFFSTARVVKLKTTKATSIRRVSTKVKALRVMSWGLGFTSTAF